ncbi:hypothetical protein MAA8898_03428 [Maliponia aquimaris]|uniref:Uncharacterized protein n=1 Tax=Maliponia aquimaris TaxID=1673631 RepID=A0A238KV06_9RHOB|nr:hypothetical protein MAA8898_03428 [Maliponia aquimaris]
MPLSVIGAGPGVPVPDVPCPSGDTTAEFRMNLELDG